MLLNPKTRSIMSICLTVFVILATVAITPHQAQADSKVGSAVAEPTRPTDAYVEATLLKRRAATAIRRALQAKVSTKFKDTSLNDALRFLATKGKFPLWINTLQLREEGVAVDVLVTLNLKDVTIKQALTHMLDPLILTHVIRNEVLEVTSLIAEEEVLVTKVYSIANLANAAKQGQPIRGRNEFAAKLVQTIQAQTTGPWQDIDGAGGTLHLLKNLLIVRCPQHIHIEAAALLTAFEAVVSGTAKKRSAQVRRPGYPLETDERIRAALRRKLSVNYRMTPLTDVAADIAKRLGVTVVVDQSALDDEGVSAKEPVTFAADAITAHSLGKLILEPLGCIFIVDKGRLYLTTEIAAEDLLYTTIHDIRDLTKAGYRSDKLISVVQSVTSGAWANIDGAGGRLSEPFPGILLVRQTDEAQTEVSLLLHDMRTALTSKPDKTDTKPAAKKPDPQKIVTRFYEIEDREHAAATEKAIVTFIAPDAWEPRGGKGVIRIVGDTLVIRQSIEVHRKIRRFLKRLQNGENGGRRDIEP